MQFNLIAKARSHKSYKSQVDPHPQGICYTHKQNLEILGILDFLRQPSSLQARENSQKDLQSKGEIPLNFASVPYRKSVSQRTDSACWPGVPDIYGKA